MTSPEALPVSRVDWTGAVRIIRSVFPPIDLFEDIADPADWPLLISAEQKTNPRIMETIGNLDLVPVERRVGGNGASFLMAPFTHIAPERRSRFSDGTYGVLYVGRAFETALFETIHHHASFMARTDEPSGWTSQFREIVLEVGAGLHDLRGLEDPALDPVSYSASHRLGADLRRSGSDGVVYPSVRHPGGECVGLFYPDGASNPVQGRHLDYHWDGARVDRCAMRGPAPSFAWWMFPERGPELVLVSLGPRSSALHFVILNLVQDPFFPTQRVLGSNSCLAARPLAGERCV